MAAGESRSRVIVQWAPGYGPKRDASRLLADVQVVDVPAGVSQQAFLQRLRATEGVVLAVPDVHIEAGSLAGPAEPRCAPSGTGQPLDELVDPGLFVSERGGGRGGRQGGGLRVPPA